MEKCLQMYMVKPIHRQSHTSMDNLKISPATVTPPHTFKARGNLISCHSSTNQAEVVTACSWTELVVAADMPVLVEFWAPWCGPSRMVDEVAKEYAGNALCYTLNIEDYPNVALQYGITSIPTLLVYKDGEKKEIIDGVVSNSTLFAILDKYTIGVD